MTKNLKAKFISFLLISTLALTGCSSDNSKKEENVSIPKDVVSNSSDKNNEQDINLSDCIVTYINTGNSDAILIEQNGKYLLIDSGDNDDESYMVNYLKNKNITKLDYFLLTHFDADHIGGADKIIDNMDIGQLFVPNGDADTKTYRDFIQSSANKNVYPSVPLEGAKFNLGSAVFEVLNTDGGENKNDDSLVVKLTNGEDVFAFMGDAGQVIENKIVNKLGDVDVLKAGHHGSHTSSGYDFVKAINPEYAIILVGQNNKYGHPHKETMDTFEKLNIKVHRSDECGEVVFKSTGNGVSTNCSNGSYSIGSNSKYNESSNNNQTVNDKKSETVVKEEQVMPESGTVYWTPNGSVYHTTQNCSTLSKSKTILNGTITESGKPRVCKNCGN